MLHLNVSDKGYARHSRRIQACYQYYFDPYRLSRIKRYSFPNNIRLSANVHKVVV